MPGTSGGVRLGRIIETVANDPAREWNDTTREKTFPADANAILEALIAEYGIEATLQALVNQGFSPTGDYRYAAKPLYEEASRRRKLRRERRDADPTGEDS